MAGIVGGSPCAAAMGVGAITDALCRLWSRLRVHEWPTRVRGGGPTSERNTSTLHFKVIRTIFFELRVSIVIIIDKPVHQESTEKPGKGPLSYPTAAKKSIKYRRPWPRNPVFLMPMINCTCLTRSTLGDTGWLRLLQLVPSPSGRASTFQVANIGGYLKHQSHYPISAGIRMIERCGFGESGEQSQFRCRPRCSAATHSSLRHLCHRQGIECRDVMREAVAN